MDVASKGGGRFGRRGIVLGLLIGAVVPAGLVMSNVRAAEPVVIRIDNFSFVPDGLTIPVGTTVTWENGDDIPHLVVLADKSFRSKPLDTHDAASFTFTKIGALDYFCGLHPHMHGRITVIP